MSNEIATYSMILSKLSLGKSGTECPTKTQILAINSLIVIDNASTYGANECVKIDDIRKKAETWNYYLTVSPTSMSFGAGGGSKSFTVSSYKRKVLDGVEQSGDTNVSLKSTTISGTGFSLSGTTVSASANEITSNRTGTVTITQNESNKTVTISLSQDGDDVSSYGEWTISVSASPTSVSSSGGTSTITASAKRTVYWVSGDVTEETGNPTLSTNLGSLSSSSSPSTLTLGENTSTSSRTATINATYSSKSATCTVTQAAGESPDVWDYVFSVNPYQVSVGSGGGSGTVTITSYETLNGSWYRDVSYSIDSSTLPSWATYDGGGSFTISANTSSSSRSANVYFVQDESGKRDYASLSQSAYAPPADNYVFTWHNGSTSNKSESFQATGAVSSAITLVSTKNGSNHPWSTTSHPGWITIVSETATIVTIQASNNTGSARSGSVVLTQEDSGKTLTINVSQAAYSATVEWRYKFGFNNGARDNISIAIRTMKEYEGASVTFTSYKSKYVDGVEDVSSRQYLDFSIGDYASWATVTKVSSSIANEGKFRFTLSSNFNNKSNRQTFVTVTQNESNKSIICDIMQVGSDAFVASYFVKFRGSDTYPSEIDFGLVTAPTSKEYEVESALRIHTIESEYNSYDYQFGAISKVYRVNNSMNFTDNSWFTNTYEVGGGSYQYDLLTINAPVSDGQNRAVPIDIVQSEYTGDIDWNYRELTNSPILDQIMVKQSGLTIS